ncbi:uncharacterized protein LOC111611348 isoform X1 [Xiphophorus maculatus]|uniref:uncharacterized protein LOC111611348 isoform X1 n=1 Tax=Xiphophorus maculatus TaxID=8083 RepID=UPI000C6D2EFD|nr:uncharacterized protein LOC111611348 isoform X1 [Xiphophorus maculatus]
MIAGSFSDDLLPPGCSFSKYRKNGFMTVRYCSFKAELNDRAIIDGAAGNPTLHLNAPPSPAGSLSPPSALYSPWYRPDPDQTDPSCGPDQMLASIPGAAAADDDDDGSPDLLLCLPVSFRKSSRTSRTFSLSFQASSCSSLTGRTEGTQLATDRFWTKNSPRVFASAGQLGGVSTCCHGDNIQVCSFLPVASSPSSSSPQRAKSSSSGRS